VTDDPSAYGLGALPDAPGERDYPLSAPYASEGLTASAVLLASYPAPGMPPVLDKHATPICVAVSSAATKGWQDGGTRRPSSPSTSPRFFLEIGGTASGAHVRGTPFSACGLPQPAPRSSSNSRRRSARRDSTMSHTSMSSTPA
jgi:hypothetical protein